MINPYIPCQRCGICCTVGPCYHGKVDNKLGICIHLRKKDKIYSCQLLVRKKVQPIDIGIGKGCVLRAIPDVFKYYEMMKNPRLIVKFSERKSSRRN